MRKLLVAGSVSDPVWSSRGELAFERGGWIWVGRPGKLHRLAAGSAPSWSPDGRQIVFVRTGWLLTGPLRGHAFRRLVRGTAPAWSPSGGWIAFFGRHHRLSVVPASGGGVRHVGTITGRLVDWQPLPAKAPPPCPSPPGSTVTANAGAVVSVDTAQVSASDAFDTGLDSWAAMGCLLPSGRQRLLATASPLFGPTSVSEVAVAAPYAALAIHSVNFKGMSQGSGVSVFDLRTSPPVMAWGGEGAFCQLSASCDIDRLVLGTDTVSGVHTTVRDNGCTCTVEQIQASDSTGVHTLDSVTEPDGSATALTNLILTGDILTWDHNGSPRSAQLAP